MRLLDPCDRDYLGAAPWEQDNPPCSECGGTGICSECDADGERCDECGCTGECPQCDTR